MIRLPFLSQRRAARHAFTLIELLAVITIILVLAGLILSIAGNANYKGSVARAQSEIQQMSTAMESYRVDNGTYPRDTADTGSTDVLNARANPPPDPSANIASSKFLFTELSGITTGTAKKAYLSFRPGQLFPLNTTPVSGTTYLIDPFGFSYGYSTIYQDAQDKNAASANSADTTKTGFNPTYDLWSTAGYGSSGKSYPTDMTDQTKYYTLWVKNW